jgi:excisionase family DNA binding protein
MSEPDSILTVAEVSEYLKLSESTIYRLAKRHGLPCRKVGGAWRFSRKGIDEWLAQAPVEGDDRLSEGNDLMQQDSS